MVPFKGESHLSVYMPTKPHKWVFKMWGCSGQSGYPYDFDVRHRAENPEREKSEVGLTGEVVLKSHPHFQQEKKHKVFADNYYKSVLLVQQLKGRGIYYIGMIWMEKVKDCTMMDEKGIEEK